LGRNFGKKAKIKFKVSRISDSREIFNRQKSFLKKEKKKEEVKNCQIFISGFQFVAKNVEE